MEDCYQECVGPEQILSYTITPLTGAAAAPLSSTTNVYCFEFSVPSFSHFIITPSTTILLDNNLTTFTAEPQGNRQSLLKWTVENSHTVATYEVERSSDGINGYTVGEVASHRQSTEDNYRFTDVSPRDGHNYYRIRAVENDGTINFSDWRVVDFDGLGGGVLIAPNPATEQVNIRLNTDSGVEIRLYNQLGQLAAMQIFATPSQTHILQLGDLPSGVYTMQILLDNQAVSTRQLIKK
jgi:hypothetical protein